jgi:hypothetical protein
MSEVEVAITFFARLLNTGGIGVFSAPMALLRELIRSARSFPELAKNVLFLS